MNKLDMNSLLSEIRKSGAPVGASYLSGRLDASAATIGRLLKQAEDQGYLQSISNKGRILTASGDAYLDSQSTDEENQQNAANVIALATSDDPQHLIDILEFRRMLEPQAMRLAIRKATAADIEAVKAIDIEHRYVLRRGESGCEEDLQFHLKFAELSGNQSAYQVLKLILTDNNVYQKFTAISTPGADGSYTDHTRIVEAFADRDEEAAVAAMENHLDNLMKLIKEMEEIK